VLPRRRRRHRRWSRGGRGHLGSFTVGCGLAEGKSRRRFRGSRFSFAPC
jgi:hypothetical protein